MIVSAIVAMGKNREIGKDNELLWKISDDLKLFKKNTLGHIIIMGRKTYESIGRPLPGRTTFILSSTLDKDALGPDVSIFRSLELALDNSAKLNEEEVFICGGGQIYQSCFSFLDQLYISDVDYEGDADAFFPEFDRASWKEVETKDYLKSEKNQYAFRFSKLKRK